MKMLTTALVLVALIALAPCASAAEKAPAASLETSAFCPTAAPQTPAAPLFAAGDPGASNQAWGCPYFEICQANCESFCGVGLGRCTPQCFCECW